MKHSLTIELSDEVFAFLQRQAFVKQTSVAEYAAELLEQRIKALPRILTDEERDAARQRFIRHLGKGTSKCSAGSDNEQIDAELAREYGNSHETGS